jgi:peptidyl-dipeptidase A
MAASPAGIQDFIAAFEDRLAPIEKASSEAWWALATTGSDEAKGELVRTGMAYNRLFADEDEYGLVKGWYQKRHVLESTVLRRQVELLYKSFSGRQGDEETLRRIEELEAEANAIHGNHRCLVRGEVKSENELREVLRASGDSDLRREAWEATKSVARTEGYENHYARSLDLQEIEAAELARIMDGLQAATDVPFRNLKRSSTPTSRRDSGSRKSCPGTRWTRSFKAANTTRLRFRARIREGIREVRLERVTRG